MVAWTERSWLQRKGRQHDEKSGEFDQIDQWKSNDVFIQLRVKIHQHEDRDLK